MSVFGEWISLNWNNFCLKTSQLVIPIHMKTILKKLTELSTSSWLFSITILKSSLYSWLNTKLRTRIRLSIHDLVLADNESDHSSRISSYKDC